MKIDVDDVDDVWNVDENVVDDVGDIKIYKEYSRDVGDVDDECDIRVDEVGVKDVGDLKEVAGIV